MTEAEKKRILIVEDEAHIAEGVKLNLELAGYQAEIAADGGGGLRLWREWKPDLIVLDIMLPVLDGMSVLRTIRMEDERIPILVLSAKGAIQDRVNGFSSGADDYIAKPFDLKEFLLRVKRLLKRVSWGLKEEEALEDADGYGSRSDDGPSVPAGYRFGANTIDFTTLKAQSPRGEIRLTEQEAKLLKLFIVHRGKPLSRERILELGWGYSRATTTRTVDNFVVRLRKYFEENPRKPRFFKSLRSVGYLFDHD